MLKKISRDINALEIKYIDNNYIFIPPLLILITELTVFFIWGFKIALLVVLPLILFLVLAFAFHLYRKTTADLEEERSQIQALMSIHQLIDIRSPLPSMTRWSAFPKLASTVIEYANIIKPELIAEAGSGVSSVISCYCLEKQGKGELFSLDHDKEYAEKTRRELSRHGLESYARIVHAPLKEYALQHGTWMWYDLEGFDSSRKIDMLVIDGPPVKTQELARFPALPLLYEHLNEKAVIILDDAGRDSEREAVQRWLDLYPEFSHEFIPTKKGISVLSRNL